MPWAALMMLAHVLVQDGPVPPQRVDPKSFPMPAANEPAMPTDGRQDQSNERPDSQPRQPGLPGTWRLLPERPSLPRSYPSASIFTDESYRQARVRSLLVKALEGRV